MTDATISNDRRIPARGFLKRLAIGVGVTLIALAIYIGYLTFGHLPQVWAFDQAFSELEVGTTVARVEELMGQPHDSYYDHYYAVQRFVYFATPPCASGSPASRYLLGVHWSVDIDASGTVVALRRTDDPC